MKEEKLRTLKEIEKYKNELRKVIKKAVNKPEFLTFNFTEGDLE